MDEQRLRAKHAFENAWIDCVVHSFKLYPSGFPTYYLFKCKLCGSSRFMSKNVFWNHGCTTPQSN